MYGDDAKADVWNEYNTEKVPNTKRGIYQNNLLIDDDRKLNISKSISRNLKDNFQNHKLKHNVSLTFIMKKYLLSMFWLITNQYIS